MVTDGKLKRKIYEKKLDELQVKLEPVHHGSRRRMLRLVPAAASHRCSAACGLPERGTAVPAGRATEATVLGLANERFFPAHGSAALEAELGLAGVDREVCALGLKSRAELPAAQLLASRAAARTGPSAPAC